MAGALVGRSRRRPPPPARHFAPARPASARNHVVIARHDPSNAPGVLLARRPRTYHRREPERSALYQTLQEHLETFLDTARASRDPLPQFVERELRAFLKCGILAHGFARVHCGECRFDRLVA